MSRHGTCVAVRMNGRTLMLSLALVLIVPATTYAEEVGPAMRVDPDRYQPALPQHVVHGPLTPAMHVWILRGTGPAGRIQALGTLDIEVVGDADTAIDALQHRAWMLHADAVIRVRVEHTTGGTRVTGMAIRYV